MSSARGANCQVEATSQARGRARDAREQLWQGVDPIEHRKTSKAALVAAQKHGMNFKDVVERFLASKLEEFSNEKHRKQWRSTLERYAEPAIGAMLVQDIGVSDIQ